MNAFHSLGSEIGQQGPLALNLSVETHPRLTQSPIAKASNPFLPASCRSRKV